MSDYSKSYDGAAKDAATSLILGADFDTEFNAISTAIATKANKKIPATTSNVATLGATGDLEDSGYTVAELLASTAGRRGALVNILSPDIAVPNGTSQTISWDAEQRDTSSIWTAGDPTKLTVPTGATYVRLHIHVSLKSISGTGYIYGGLIKNGAGLGFASPDFRIDSAISSIYQWIASSPIISVTPGDYFEIYVQSAGTSAACSIAYGAGYPATWFELEVIE